MPGGDTLTIRVQNTADDLRGLHFSAGDRSSPRLGFLPAVPSILLGLLLALVVGPDWLRAQFEISYLGGVAATAVLIAAVVWSTIFLFGYVSRETQLDPNGMFLQPSEITLSSENVRVENTRAKTELLWDAFLKAQETATHFFLYIDRRTAYIVPKREFASQSDADRFRKILRAHMEVIPPLDEAKHA